MLRVLVTLFLLLVTSCSFNILEEEHKYPIQCDKHSEIKYCEGYNPRDMDCRCMKLETGVFSEYRIA